MNTMDGMIRWSLKNRLFVVVAATALSIYGAHHGGADAGRRLPRPDGANGHRAHRGARHGARPRSRPGHLSHRDGAQRRRRAYGGCARPPGSESRSSGSSSTGAPTSIMARQIVTERLQWSRAACRPRSPPPALAPVSSIMGEILFIALRREQHSPHGAREDRRLDHPPRLLAVPGVARSCPSAATSSSTRCIVDPRSLRAYGLTLDEVSAALRDANQNATAGFYVESAQEYLIQGRAASAARRHRRDRGRLRDGMPVLHPPYRRGRHRPRHQARRRLRTTASRR